MPYKSEKQRKYMHWAAEKGKIDPKVVAEFDRKERLEKIKKHLKNKKK